MENQALLKRVVSLETQVNRLETMMQVLLLRLGINPAEITPPELTEDQARRNAIRAELQAGNKVTAVKLYCEYYGVSTKEANAAINALL